MATASVLTVGCTSDHGGKIITGDPIMKIDGKPVARIGDLHSCPKFYPTATPTKNTTTVVTQFPHKISPIIKTAKVATRGMVNMREFAYEGDTTGCGAKLLRCSANATGIALKVGVGLALLGVGVLLAMKHNKSPSSTDTPVDPREENKQSAEAIQNRIQGVNDFINRNLNTPEVQKVVETKDSTCSCDVKPKT